jgi:hypothetical protein
VKGNSESFKMMFDLPEALVTSILHQWITVQVLNRLDSACCATCPREQLLQIFSNDNFIAHAEIACSKLDSAGLRWLTKRMMKVSLLTLHGFGDLEALQLYCTTVGGRHVRRVQLVNVQRINDVLEALSVHCGAVSDVDIRDAICRVAVTPLLIACSAQIHTVLFDSITLVESNFAGLHLPNLRRLYLNCTYTPEVLHAFLSASTRFEQVRVVRVPGDDEAVNLLCNSAASLRGLGIENCLGVSSAALQKLAGRCTSLRVIQLQQCGPFNELGVAALIASSVQLESVLLNGSVGNLSLMSIAQRCGPQLLHLSLGEVSCPDNTGIDALAEKCHHIVSLHYRASGVSVAAVLRLVAAQKALCELSFALTHIDDTVLGATVQHASSLTYLDLYHTTGYKLQTLLKTVVLLGSLEVLCVDENNEGTFWGLLKCVRKDLQLKHRFASPPSWKKRRWMSE